jgi:hypothetical protein
VSLVLISPTLVGRQPLSSPISFFLRLSLFLFHFHLLSPSLSHAFLRPLFRSFPSSSLFLPLCVKFSFPPFFLVFPPSSFPPPSSPSFFFLLLFVFSPPRWPPLSSASCPRLFLRLALPRSPAGGLAAPFLGSLFWFVAPAVSLSLVRLSVCFFSFPPRLPAVALLCRFLAPLPRQSL